MSDVRLLSDEQLLSRVNNRSDVSSLSDDELLRRVNGTGATPADMTGSSTPAIMASGASPSRDFATAESDVSRVQPEPRTLDPRLATIGEHEPTNLERLNADAAGFVSQALSPILGDPSQTGNDGSLSPYAKWVKGARQDSPSSFGAFNMVGDVVPFSASAAIGSKLLPKAVQTLSPLAQKILQGTATGAAYGSGQVAGRVMSGQDAELSQVPLDAALFGGMDAGLHGAGKLYKALRGVAPVAEKAVAPIVNREVAPVAEQSIGKELTTQLVAPKTKALSTEPTLFEKIRGKSDPEVIRIVLDSYKLPALSDVKNMTVSQLFSERERLAKLSTMPFRDSGLTLAGKLAGGNLDRTGRLDRIISKQANLIAGYIDRRLEGESMRRFGGVVDFEKLKSSFPEQSIEPVTRGRVKMEPASEVVPTPQAKLKPEVPKSGDVEFKQGELGEVKPVAKEPHQFSDAELLSEHKKLRGQTYESIQKRIDERYDELERSGMSFDQINEEPSINALYRDRYVVEQTESRAAQSGLVASINKADPSVDAKSILRDVYYIDPQSPAGLGMANQYGLKAIGDTEASVKKIYQKLMEDYGREHGLDMEGYLNPKLSGLTEKGIKDFQRDILKKAVAIHRAVNDYFVKNPYPDPTVNLLTSKITKPALPPESRNAATGAKMPAEAPKVEPVVPKAGDEASSATHAVRMQKSMEPVGNKPTTINDIRQHFEKNLGVVIRTGKITMRPMGMKAAGVFSPHSKTIRLKDYGNIETLSHEAAHKIDDKFALRKGIIREHAKELGPLDYDEMKNRPFEGFAEYFRYYITGAGDAKALAPKFTVAFEKFLDKNPELKQTIQQGKSLFDSWRSQGAEARVKATIVNTPESSPIKEKFVNAKNWYLREFDDALTPLRHYTEAAEKAAGRTLRGHENPFELATAVKGTAPAKAHNWINESTTDFDGKVTGQGLRQIFKGVVGKEEQAIEYAYAKHGIERWGQGKNPGSDLADLKYVVEKNKSPEFEQFSKDISAYRDRLLQYVVDAGAFDPATAKLFRETYQSSIPLYREGFEKGLGGGTGKGYADLPNPMKRAHGSGRMVVNPIAGLMKETERLISFADRSRVGSLIAETAEKYQGLGSWVEKVNLPAKATKLDSDQVLKKFKESGIDIGEIGNLDRKELDKVLTTWSQQVHGVPNENIVTFYKDGKLKAYQLKPELYEGIKEVNPWQAEGFLRLLTIPKKTVAAGATALRPSFGLLTNLLRDPWTALQQSRLGKTTPFRSLGGTARMAANKLGLDKKIGIDAKNVELWKRVGGEQATFFNSELPRALENTKRIIADNRQSKAMNVVRHPVELYRQILGTPEAGPRAAEFTAIYDKVFKETGNARAAWVEALNSSKNVTMNFGRAGHTAALINQFVPFFNPAIQEPGLVVRTFRRNPTGTLAKGIAGMTIPSIALWYANKDQDWYKATPTWEKATFWHFRINDTTWRLPKPFLWGAMFASFPEAVLDSFDKHDPGIAKEMAEQILRNTVPPVLPPFVSVPAALGAGEGGYDYFRGRPIVPQSQVENLPPEERYGKYTSETAKKIGGAFGVSPSKVDYGISGFTGGLGTDIIQAAEKPFTDKAVSGELANTPMIGRLVSRSPYLNKFYDEADKAQEKVKALNVKPRLTWTPEEQKTYGEQKRFEATSRRLAAIRKQITQINNSNTSGESKGAHIGALNKTMEDIAHRFLYGSAKVDVSK